MRALTGLKTEQFLLLLPVFELLLIEEKRERYKDNDRKIGSGQTSELKEPKNKLFFILNYMKCYSTFDHLAFSFNISRASACENCHRLFPILIETLAHFNALPKTYFVTPEEMQEAFGDVETLIIDATERAIQRSKDYEIQKAHFSGKARKHTDKNTVIASMGYLILYIGLTFAGKNHDYGMLKKEFDSKLNWFSNFRILVDLGYKGIDKNYTIKNLLIPHKKPRKSKNNPNPSLTETQKQENREMSRQRVIVENVIGGMKRYRCLVDKFRNTMTGLTDIVIYLAAGLWNFNVMTR